MKMCFHEKTLSPIPGGISLRHGYGECGKIDAKEIAEREFSTCSCKPIAKGQTILFLSLPSSHLKHLSFIQQKIIQDTLPGSAGFNFSYI